ncbi:MAG TPA: hypothetical protein V6D50_27350 [Chroococcales cyanobacterium]|jgi:hypothetical protein
MFRRLLQAAVITFLLNLIAHMNPSNDTSRIAIEPSHVGSKLLLGLR